MGIKVDIEKAYDTLNWDTILATMTKMNFPSMWISYIKACLNSTYFSILVNGVPTNWIFPSRGVRQGDPLSPFLFILVAQNLTLMLNFVNQLAFIPNFSSNLSYNFNHVMYADNLILITTATRKSARNIKLCLDLYYHIFGQKPNLQKSEIPSPVGLTKEFPPEIVPSLILIWSTPLSIIWVLAFLKSSFLLLISTLWLIN